MRTLRGSITLPYERTKNKEYNSNELIVSSVREIVVVCALVSDYKIIVLVIHFSLLQGEVRYYDSILFSPLD